MVLIMFIIYADSTLNDGGQGIKLIVEISTSKSNARFSMLSTVVSSLA